jgi:hypothetical protein
MKQIKVRLISHYCPVKISSGESWKLQERKCPLKKLLPEMSSGFGRSADLNF